MLDKKPAARPSMDEFLRELERIQTSGKVDGPIDLRPSEHIVGTPADQSVSSGVIRDQVNERVRATDKLAQVMGPASPQQTTGTGSLGEQVAVSRYSRRSIGALAGLAALIVIAGSAGWLLLRPQPAAKVGDAASTAAATAAASQPAAAPIPASSPAPAPAAPAPAGSAPVPAPRVSPEPSEPEAAPQSASSKGKAASKSSRKATRKTSKSGKKDPIKIDLWK